MARLAKVVYEDSDDELPDLATVAKQQQHAPLKLKMKSTASKVPTTFTTSKSASSNSHSDPDSNAENNDPATAYQQVTIRHIEKPEKSTKPKARKRILKPLSDNSLLLPLDNLRKSSKIPQNFQEEMVANIEVKPKLLRQRPARKASKPAFRSSHYSDWEDDPFNDGSDGLSDFVVDDEASLSEADSDYESPPPPPKSTRKLVRGRRPENRSPPQETSKFTRQIETAAVVRKDEQKMKDVCKNMSTITNLMSTIDLLTSEDEAPRKPTLSRPEMKTSKGEEYRPGTAGTSSGFDEPLPNLRFSPPKFRKPAKIQRKERCGTPPTSPPSKEQTSLKSPTKLKLSRIPATPHRASTDAFWNQDVVNDWNDEYSPQKATAPKSTGRLRMLAEDSEFEDDIPPPLTSSKKNVARPSRQVATAKKAFMQNKHEIASSFLQELDNIITKGQISKMSASTGGIKIVWSKTLKTTAGRANWKREAIRARPLSIDSTTQISHNHHATIELAEKVIDDEERLLNVLAHEFCHLANFMISGIKTNPHGKEFKEWAAKCSEAFGHRGIEVTTKHSYEIDYKYVWECENCGMEFKRHSKSIDPKRHQCGSCKSKLVQTKPVPRTNIAGVVGGMSEYQAFLKANMKLVREQNPGSPQKEIMSLVGKRYQEYKASKLTLESKVCNGKETIVIDEEVTTTKESSPMDAVARKLDFLDLGKP